MDKPLKYAVFGAGSWATAIVKMLCKNLDEVGWYMRSVYIKEHLQREQHNPSYLSSVEFHIEQLKLFEQFIQYSMDQQSQSVEMSSDCS